jgi:hypothetical protein
MSSSLPASGRLVRDVVGREHEDLADHVGVLLVAGHEADDLAAGRAFDDVLEALAHDLLEGHALADEVIAVTTFEQGLLHARQVAAEQADDEVV